MSKTYIKALENSNKAYFQMSEKEGLSFHQKNQFGDRCLMIDWKCEQAVIDSLKESQIPIRIISEEHGVVDLDSAPKFLGFLDGIDGTSAAEKDYSGGRFATMFGVASELNPKYSHISFGGIYEHSTRNSVNSLDVQKKVSTKKLSRAKIYLDQYGPNLNLFQKFINHQNVSYLDSSGSHYLDLATGKVDAVLECTRKGNLEIAVAYPIIKNAGGTVVDINGEDIGNKEYNEWGQGANEHLPIISASSQALANEVIEFLNN